MKSVHDSSPQFMSRLINYFEGEKDPRNLMIVFSILKVPMTEWDIGSDAQVGSSCHIHVTLILLIHFCA